MIGSIMRTGVKLDSDSSCILIIHSYCQTVLISRPSLDMLLDAALSTASPDSLVNSNTHSETGHNSTVSSCQARFACVGSSRKILHQSMTAVTKRHRAFHVCMHKLDSDAHVECLLVLHTERRIAVTAVLKNPSTRD